MKMFNDDTIELNAQSSLFIGSRRIVYQHPDIEGLLLKVHKPQNPDWKKRQQFLKTPKTIRYGGFLSWYEEYSELLSIISHSNTLPDFLPKYYGFCNTDLGPAMVEEKITDTNKNVAPTVRQLIDSGECDERLIGLVENLFESIKDSQCTALDLHAGNVVVKGDFEKLIIVDGLGDKVLFKIRKYSKLLKTRTYNRRKSKILRQIHESMAT